MKEAVFLIGFAVYRTHEEHTPPEISKPYTK